jgi:hypothetical protein
MAMFRRQTRTRGAVSGALLCCSIAAAYAAASAPPAGAAVPPRALRASRALWATIDVCNPSDQPYTVGVRGSMPSDGQPRDAMLMRFRLQYLDPTLKRWIDLPGASSAFVSLGFAPTARQAGRSFVLYAPPAGGSYTLRGVVVFQWRQGKHVVAALSRASSAGHQSVAGADPANFSTAICHIR